MAENEKVEQSVSSAPKADKAKKDKKSDKKSKPGVFARIGRWFRELKIELKKVVWQADRQQHPDRHRLCYRCGHFHLAV